MVFGHERGQGYPRDVLLVLLTPSDCISLYSGYLGAIDSFCSDDFVCVNWTVPDIVLFGGLI